MNASITPKNEAVWLVFSSDGTIAQTSVMHVKNANKVSIELLVQGYYVIPFSYEYNENMYHFFISALPSIPFTMVMSLAEEQIEEWFSENEQTIKNCKVSDGDFDRWARVFED